MHNGDTPAVACEHWQRWRDDVTLYFQRRGDNWSARGPFETYRWYATFASHMPIEPGEHEIVAPLDANWTAVMTSSARTAPAAFRDALRHANRVGFVLGGGDGYGHGVFATGRARPIPTGASRRDIGHARPDSAARSCNPAPGPKAKADA